MLFHRTKRALIVGCGQFGAQLAKGLFDRKYNVTVIDKDEDAFRRLHDAYSGYTVAADGMSAMVLETCGASATDVLVAATGNDNANILIAEIASAVFGIPKVFARLNDEKKEELFDGLNIESICPHRLCVAAFQEASGIDMGLEVDRS